MNIVVCGAGEIGSHAVETLARQAHRITLVDVDGERLRSLGDNFDIGTIEGNAARGDVLARAGAADADLVLAATDLDEINLLAAAVAKALGAARTVARVHQTEFYQQRGIDYRRHLGIDLLICPEYAAAQAIARRIRTPGAVAIETFARGRIEMQELLASEGGSAIGRRLADVRMPDGSRLALIRRRREALVPEAKSVVVAGDSITLVANADVFDDARRRFVDDKAPRKRIVLMGGAPIAVWLCSFLRGRSYAIRLFEQNRVRAEELAEQLSWVTVINSDPTDRSVFEDEDLAQADAFVSLLDSDEANIISAVFAKTRGVPDVLTVVHKAKYLDMVYDLGVDAAFSTRRTAVEEIESFIDASPLRLMGMLADGTAQVVRVRVPERSPAVDRSLRELALSPDWVVAAIEHGDAMTVPGASDVVHAGDNVLLIGRSGSEKTVETVFGIHR
ncbi:MAG: Trk system potassium transporter TrkA [Phycisphaeraceae bacterium]|nr:Trk system potassium transporter TrkA [Phycisphaeraceae bacterium]